MTTSKYNGVKVFSATMVKDREALGERVTEWLRENRATLDVVDTIVTQSSDEQFHCIAITVFYLTRGDAVAISKPSAAGSASPDAKRLNFKRSES